MATFVTKMVFLKENNMCGAVKGLLSLCVYYVLQNGDKETALHSASQFGHLDTVRLLLEHLADPNIKNSKDETPLDLAALYGRFV